ncbi:L-ribulose-5-phosphate 3-epimerase UlaE [Anatilimnocola aggregata]|uniref:L-ribulose-5-phosphate 3-epimerase UlaE n=1 Tax=Anatilimnocola aggregata TaxID=2528021 RepID=A0A517YBQ7_9BACT|nr:sugar phosphate isomerase/epimerase [Anatilimnocola aggregata]QDU27693.1 L-ribulose-5-phosphate 3-epimerase UlaE [Anatilimnocola aggregata]
MTKFSRPAPLDRRSFLTAGSVFAAGFMLPIASAAPPPQQRIPLLGFSLYGMKTLPLNKALTQCASIGYQCVELPVLAGWPADTATFTAATKKDFRANAEKNKLRLSAIMDNLPLLGDEAKHRANLGRLKAAALLAHELAPSDPPLVETVLGGKPAQWDEVKQQFVDRLGEWAQVMADAKVKLAVKAHISNAMQRPEQLAWVIDQVKNPWLTAAYDYSHFELQKLTMAETIQPLASKMTFVHVKDAEGEPGKFKFLLPGEGKTDYKELFSQLSQAGYTGDIVVEVSGQVFSQAGYDPIAAAKKCFAALPPIGTKQASR